jgi:hypothetical protein
MLCHSLVSILILRGNWLWQVLNIFDRRIIFMLDVLCNDRQRSEFSRNLFGFIRWRRGNNILRCHSWPIALNGNPLVLLNALAVGPDDLVLWFG